MRLVRYIANLGYGSRREAAGMLRAGRITRSDTTPLAEGDSFTHDDVRIDNEPLDPAPGAVVMLHKPVGYVCSTSEASRLVYELLPPRFLKRSPVMSVAGRLDRDTSGLLLLTDDGQLNHRMTSPRAHLPRVYDVRFATALRGDEVELFASGEMMLETEATPLKPARLEIIDSRTARITLTEGRYHQVRRMFAAVGNFVEALHRRGTGGLELGSLGEGEWRILDSSDRMRLLDNADARSGNNCSEP